MNQPVEVGLFFPRSGQQVFVTVSAAIADSLGASRYEQRPRPVEMPSRTYITPGSATGDSAFRAN